MAHVDCSCPKEKIIPEIELLFLRDQRQRNKKGLAIGNKERVESERIAAKYSRKASMAESEHRRRRTNLEEEVSRQCSSTLSEIVDIASITANSDEDSDNETDPDFNAKLKR